MNMIELIALTHTAFNRRPPKLTDTESTRIIASLKNSEILRAFLNQHQPWGFETLENRKIARARAGIVDAIENIESHNPRLNQKRAETALWLQAQTFFTGNADDLTIRAEHQAELEEWVSSHTELNTSHKNILLQYIPFFFEKYTEGATGAANLFAAMGYVRSTSIPCEPSTLPDSDLKTTVSAETITQSLIHIAEKKLTLLTAILVAAEGYKLSTMKFFQKENRDYSCMVGLDKRILDDMFAIKTSLEHDSQAMPLTMQYIRAIVDPFISHNSEGIYPSELLYYAWMKAAHYDCKETPLKQSIDLEPPESEAYRVAQEAYITNRIGMLKQQLYEYYDLCEDNKDSRAHFSAKRLLSKSVRKRTLKNHLDPYLRPTSDLIVLQTDRVLHTQLTDCFRTLYVQYHHMELEDYETPASILPPYLLALNITPSLFRKPFGIIQKSQEDILQALSADTGLDADHIAALCVYAGGKSYNPTDIFQVMRIQCEGLSRKLRWTEATFRAELLNIQIEIHRLEKALFSANPEEALQSALTLSVRSYLIPRLHAMTSQTIWLLGSDRQMAHYINSPFNSASDLVLQKLALRCAEQGYTQTLFNILTQQHPTWFLSLNPLKHYAKLLETACLHNHSDVVSMLIAMGANIEIKNSAGETPLCQACTEGHLPIVKILLKAKANIHTTDRQYGSGQGDTPLSKSCMQGHLEIVKILLKSGANMHTENQYGDTPLSHACMLGYTDIILMLLKYGANIHEKDRHHHATPLSMVYALEDRKSVKALLDAGADIQDINIQDIKALCYYTSDLNKTKAVFKEILEPLKKLYEQKSTWKNLKTCIAVQQILSPPYWLHGFGAMIAMGLELYKRTQNHHIAPIPPCDCSPFRAPCITHHESTYHHDVSLTPIVHSRLKPSRP